jgi:hypothetical protein
MSSSKRELASSSVSDRRCRLSFPSAPLFCILGTEHRAWSKPRLIYPMHRHITMKQPLSRRENHVIHFCSSRVSLQSYQALLLSTKINLIVTRKTPNTSPRYSASQARLRVCSGRGKQYAASLPPALSCHSAFPLPMNQSTSTA